MFVFRLVQVGFIVCVSLLLGSLQNPLQATASLKQPAASFRGGIAAGINHTCAWTNSGTIKCWGRNLEEQLGIGSSPINRLTSPVEVSGLQKVRGIVAGNTHTCAFNNIGAVYCWGENRYGELGNGSTDKTSGLVAVRWLKGGATMISSRYQHTCVLRTTSRDTRQVVCWGYNGFGQVGDNITQAASSPVPIKSSPVPIKLSNPISISVGEQHSCALTSTKEVYCWGRNDYGQLGVDPIITTQSVTPIKPSNLPGLVKTVVAGPLQTCAVLESNDVYCWGLNDSGNLGDGSTVPSQVVWNPVKVIATDTAQIMSLTVGHRHTCALNKDKTVKCWGANDQGQLGDGTYQNNPKAVSVSIEPVRSITAGHYHTCAVLETGQVKCWGMDWEGQLGSGRVWDPSVLNTTSNSPTLVSGLNLNVP